MAISQKNRPIQVATPLGDDILLFFRMQGIEKLGDLFEYELEMLSENNAIKPDNLLGENITVGVKLPEGGWRYFNGHVARFRQQETINGFAVYRATLRPWLWFLTRAAKCRIFQLSAIDRARHRQAGISRPRFLLASRLLEEEGIYYFFIHENGKHHLVLADPPSAHDTFPGYEKIPYHPEHSSTDKTRADHIHEWTFGMEVQTGVLAQTDMAR
jgi:type VI secretion system secreted protein VgrG